MSSSGARGYSSFYQHIALSPGLGKFRRFGAFWAKRVHDETGELLACIATLDEEIRKFPTLDAATVLDSPKRIVQDNCPRTDPHYKPLHDAWDAYDKALMRYGEVLCMSERIMNLPTQDKFNTEKMLLWKLPHFKPIFEQNEFVPTGEVDKKYQGDPDTTDTCAWCAIAHDDILTNRFWQASPWIDKHILDRWRYHVHGVKPDDAQLPPILRYKHLVRTLDTLTCALASVFLAMTIAVLKAVRTTSIRIVVTGILGTLFAVLLMVMAGSMTRDKAFTATAGFYAVAAVFLSTTNSDGICH